MLMIMGSLERIVQMSHARLFPQRTQWSLLSLSQAVNTFKHSVACDLMLNRTVSSLPGRPASCANVSQVLCSRWRSDHCYVRPVQSSNALVNKSMILSGNLHRRHISGVHKPIVAKFTEQIDIEQLKEDLRQQRNAGDKTVNLSQKIKEAVSEKCDEVIANLSPEEQKQLKIVQLEHNFLYSEGYEILSPEHMTNENWLEALNLSSKVRRLKYYLYLQKRKYVKASQKEKQKGTGIVTKPMNMYEHGRIFMRIYESTMRKWQSYRLSTSMQYGIPLVFDMDYQKEMRASDVKGTADQLIDVYGRNRMDASMPFHLHFLNCPEDNSIYKVFQILMQDSPDVMLTVSEQSYLDVFNKRDLIYLSPNGRQVMREFDPNAVYIVGAFNDKATSKPVSYARAREQGIRCQRLPLDEHLKWTQGRKDLTLNQMLLILQALKNKHSWKEALKFVPKRKVGSKD